MGECYTDIEKCRTQYKWTIQQFNSHLDLCENFMETSDINLQSPEFYTKIDGHLTTWYLQVHFNGIEEEYSDWISFRVNCTSEMENNIIGLYNIYVVKGNGKKVLICKNDKLIGFKNRSTLLVNKFYRKEAILKQIDDLLLHNTLTIVYEVVMLGEPITARGPKPITLPKYELLEDYQKLYATCKCSDVIFVIGDMKIKAHKAILIARSAVFTAMFRCEMNESNENCVNITDISLDVFNELLRFIYTNEVHHLNELNRELLFAADKYQIELLRGICEYSLYESLDVKNASQTLVLADNYNCPQLATHTINFINKHALDVMDTLGYKAMEKSHPYLVTAIYKAYLIDRKIQKKQKESDFIKNCLTPNSESP